MYKVEDFISEIREMGFDKFKETFISNLVKVYNKHETEARYNEQNMKRFIDDIPFEFFNMLIEYDNIIISAIRSKKEGGNGYSYPTFSQTGYECEHEEGFMTARYELYTSNVLDSVTTDVYVYDLLFVLNGKKLDVKIHHTTFFEILYVMEFITFAEFLYYICNFVDFGIKMENSELIHYGGDSISRTNIFDEYCFCYDELGIHHYIRRLELIDTPKLKREPKELRKVLEFILSQYELKMDEYNYKSSTYLDYVDVQQLYEYLIDVEYNIIEDEKGNNIFDREICIPMNTLVDKFPILTPKLAKLSAKLYNKYNKINFEYCSILNYSDLFHLKLSKDGLSFELIEQHSKDAWIMGAIKHGIKVTDYSKNAMDVVVLPKNVYDNFLNVVKKMVDDSL